MTQWPRTHGSVTLPLRTHNPLNGSHGHWRVSSKARKTQRSSAFLASPQVQLPCVVTLVRLSAGTLDDDNLRAALKAIRDGVADRLQVADNDPRVRWQYAQERCRAKEYGVRIELQSDPKVAPG